jgi:uncharacterized membrane protein YphA (DoxX/SURF4 family)
VTDRVAGTIPSLPWFLKPLAGTIPAERLAAFRIGVGLVLLLDICWTFLPNLTLLFGPDGLSPRDMFAAQFRAPHAYWSLLRVLPETWGPQALVAVWTISAVALVLGWRPHLAGLVAWACSVSVWSANPFLNNSGDLVRNFALVLVTVAHTGAAWGVSSPKGKWSVPAWPVAVILVQLSCIYFVSGVHKFRAPAWRSGEVMWNVCHDLNWSLIPGLADQIPMTSYRLSAWATLWWELGFPFLICYPFTRKLALWLGVLFHVGTALTLEVSLFPWWSLALYLPLVPWERLRSQPAAADEMAATSPSS